MIGNCGSGAPHRLSETDVELGILTEAARDTAGRHIESDGEFIAVRQIGTIRHHRDRAQADEPSIGIGRSRRGPVVVEERLGIVGVLERTRERLPREQRAPECDTDFRDGVSTDRIIGMRSNADRDFMSCRPLPSCSPSTRWWTPTI